MMVCGSDGLFAAWARVTMGASNTWAGGRAWGHSEEELTVDHILSDPNILQFAE